MLSPQQARQVVGRLPTRRPVPAAAPESASPLLPDPVERSSRLDGVRVVE